MKITMQKANDLTFEEGYQKFLQRCRVKNLSEKTIEYYNKEFRRFSQFLDSTVLLQNITAETIEEHVLEHQATEEIYSIIKLKHFPTISQNI